MKCKGAPPVTLVMDVLTSKGHRYYKPVVSANGKIKHLHAVVSGTAQLHPEATCYLRYREGGKTRLKSAGKDLDAALMAQRRLQSTLERVALGEAGATAANSASLPHTTIDEAMADYIADVASQRSLKTSRAYSFVLGLFRKSCQKNYLDELTRRDLIDFMTFLRSRGQADRSIYNKISEMKTFLRAAGVPEILGHKDTPRYTAKKVRSYALDNLNQLLATATAEEHMLFSFFLGTGGREQEVQYATWPDIDFADATFTVTEKLDLGFRPKDREERTVPINDSLLALLADRRRLNPKARLIFTNTLGWPNGHFLRILKKLALKARLNCGFCTSKAGLSCADHPVCKGWELHRFRKTFATMSAAAGVPPHTIRLWLGHSDLETTLSYLADTSSRAQTTRTLVNATFASVSAGTNHAGSPAASSQAETSTGLFVVSRAPESHPAATMDAT